MKARIIKDENNKIHLLCSDGTTEKVSAARLSSLLMDFLRIESFSGKNGHWNESYFDMSEVPGKTLAIVADNNALVIQDPWLLAYLNTANESIRTDYLTIHEYAKKHDRSKEMIKAFCREGRIQGAFRKGRAWLIPADSPYPVDVRSRKPDSGRKPAAAKENRA